MVILDKKVRKNDRVSVIANGKKAEGFVHSINAFDTGYLVIEKKLGFLEALYITEIESIEVLEANCEVGRMIMA